MSKRAGRNNAVMFVYDDTGVVAKRGDKVIGRVDCVACSRKSDKTAFACFDLVDAKGNRRRFTVATRGIREG